MIINLNGHPIDAIVDGKEITYPACENPARVQVMYVKDDEMDGIPLFRPVYGKIENLPPPQDGVLYIVSVIVGPRGAARGRRDLIGPDRRNETVVRYPDDHPKRGLTKAVTGFLRY